MTNFDEPDFSECRSEEVISFFWRSVLLLIDNFAWLNNRCLSSIRSVYQLELIEAHCKA